MKKHTSGFTLIELMVVVSIVTLLSSIFFASSASAYRKSRDTKRQQQVHQVDLAVQQYVLDKGHAPDLQDTCLAGPEALASGCVAVSNSNDPVEQAAWDKFKEDLKDYIPDIPDDPCGSSCESASGAPLAYVYVAPAAMQELCVEPCTMSIADLNDSYQLYASLETNPQPVAVASFEPLYSSVIVNPTLVQYMTPSQFSPYGDYYFTYTNAVFVVDDYLMNIGEVLKHSIVLYSTEVENNFVMINQDESCGSATPGFLTHCTETSGAVIGTNSSVPEVVQAYNQVVSTFSTVAPPTLTVNISADKEYTTDEYDTFTITWSSPGAVSCVGRDSNKSYSEPSWDDTPIPVNGNQTFRILGSVAIQHFFTVKCENSGVFGESTIIVSGPVRLISI